MADIQEALLTYIYARLVADTGLKSDMGGTVRLAHVWAKPDTAFPYLVHRIDVAPDATGYILRRATYYIDIWSDSPNASEILAIREEIITSLDELEFDTANDEATRARFALQTESFIPEEEDGILHYAIMFNLNYFRDSEITAIDSR